MNGSPQGPQDLDGLDVLDASGTKVGSVERTYDDDTGTARYVQVSMGGLFSRQYRLVPVVGAQATDDGIRVSYSEPVIASSPDASDADDTLQDDLLVRVQGYYDGNGPGTTQTVEDDRDAVDAVAVESRSIPTGEAGLDQEASNFDEVRDLGDVIEVPIVEEELVKRPVVKEVLRIRKTQEPRTETIQGAVRKEEVEVIREGDAVIRGDTSTKIDE